MLDCGNPNQQGKIARNTALGIDHFVGTWLNPGGSVVPGSAHPGDSIVNALAGTNQDACNEVAGEAVAVEGVPLNTMLVDTGFPHQAMFDGLISRWMIPF